MKIVLILISTVIGLGLCFFFLGELTDRIQNIFLRKSLKRRIRDQGKEKTIEEIALRIKMLETDMQETQKRCTSRFSAPLGGVLKELRRKKVEKAIAEKIEE